MIHKEQIKNNRVIRRCYYYLRGLIKKKELEKKAEETLKKFDFMCENEIEKQELISDMIRMNMLYGFNFNEYLLYSFNERGAEDRLTFVADWEHLGYTCAMNSYSNAEIFDNKYKTFCTYKNYFKRELLYCDGKADKKSFNEFIKKFPNFIVKPVDASCGHGVRVYKGTKEIGLYDTLLKDNKGKIVVEELILQDKRMEKFHPASVNTVRVPTIKVGDEVQIVHPFFRIGQHGNCVDNAGAGGIICTLDVKTGRILEAADEYGKHYVKHPDSGEQIIGFQIPKWDEAKIFVSELAGIVPTNRYTGWDLALTQNGWVLVEANRRGQFVWQIPDQVGFREKINCFLKKMRTKY